MPITNGEPVLDELTEIVLKALKPGTQKTYRPAAKEFEHFAAQYKIYPLTGIHGFLKLLQEDRKLDPLEQKAPENTVLRDFDIYLKNPDRRPDSRQLSDKSCRDYVSVIQAIGKKKNIPINLKNIEISKGNIASEKHAWNLDEFAQYVSRMEFKYQVLNVCMFQSGMDGDLYNLKYGAIKAEFEAGTIPLALFPKDGYCYRGKTNVKYRSFLGTLGVKLLRVYLKERALTENPLKVDTQNAQNGADSYIDLKELTLPDEAFVFDISQRSAQSYVKRHAEDMFGEWQGTNPYRLHSLRDFFRKIVIKAGVPEGYAEFMLAHNMKEVAKMYISMAPEEWRDIYRIAEPVLSFKIPVPKPVKTKKAKAKEAA
jgi:hypothetical protein